MNPRKIYICDGDFSMCSIRIRISGLSNTYVGRDSDGQTIMK